MEQARLSLPTILKLELTNFSLYETEDHIITIDFRKPAACIIGANGLGKSTMLNCINYGLTGMINEPGRKIKSINEYYKYNKYYIDYFDGRIQEKDRDFASVSVTFLINNVEIVVTRRFFPNNSVIYFKCSEPGYVSYEEAIIRLSTLKTFEQFAFLQVKILTFDEQRECLFWDPDLLTSTLYLTMNLSPEVAEQADLLSRDVQKSNSRIRNLQFEINKLNKRIEFLRDELSVNSEDNNYKDELSDIEIKEKHELLVEGLQKAENDYLRAKTELEFLTSVISEATAKQHLAKSEYDKLYNLLFASNSNIGIRNNPIISELMQGHCVICDASGPTIWQVAEKKILANKCPLCETELRTHEHDQEDIVRKLQDVDNRIQKLNSELQENISKSTRLRESMQSTANYIEKNKLELLKIEQGSAFLAIKERSGSNDSDDKIINRIRSLQSASLEVEVDKDKEIENRDRLRDEAAEIHKQLTRSYEEARKNFLPKFRSLARAFTGLNVDILLTEITNDAKKLLSFSLSLEDSGRTHDHQLSESQRFFLDIALRMAIVDYIADDLNEGCMLIDTPEGSLDIAYEANAGEMFAEFINRKHQLIITANINSSGLVKTLAKKTGTVSFNLINIITWANLSSVQTKRMDLFNEALREIEDAMKSGDEM